MEHLNYFMPAEWEQHKGTIVAWPSNKQTWEGVYEDVAWCMANLISVISKYEDVYVSVKPTDDKNQIMQMITEKNGNETNIFLLDINNNDSWTRDYGPVYVFSKEQNDNVAIVDWSYNAWGEKYPPWNDDVKFTKRFANWIGCRNIFDPNMILEGGSIDVNGKGVLLSTTNCLLNINRNPQLSQYEIEKKLREYLGITEIIWLKEGIVGDDTDGHIDDFARFISDKKIICCVETNKNDDNYVILNNAYDALVKNEVVQKNKIEIILLPMPTPKFFNGIRLPLSYANFYFVNGALLVPTFDDPIDETALAVLADHIKDREIIGVRGLPFLRGLGGIHCLTQQVYG